MNGFVYSALIGASLLVAPALPAQREPHTALGGHFSLAPECFVDLIESGENTWVAGVALGYEF